MRVSKEYNDRWTKPLREEYLRETSSDFVRQLGTIVAPLMEVAE